MAHLFDLNLIRVFDFYLASLFLISIYMHVRQYEAIVRLLRPAGSLASAHAARRSAP